jgi:excisionase family DNA binding protein
VKGEEKSPYRKALEELVIHELIDKKSALTIELAAVYLNLSVGKLREMAKVGEVPCTMLAGKYVFSKRLLDEWVEKLVLGAALEDVSKNRKGEKDN